MGPLSLECHQPLAHFACVHLVFFVDALFTGFNSCRVKFIALSTGGIHDKKVSGLMGMPVTSGTGSAYGRASGPHYILDLLLSILPSLSSQVALLTCIQLVTIVGQRAISVSHLKRIFRLLHTEGRGSEGSVPTDRLSYGALLLEALHCMTSVDGIGSLSGTNAHLDPSTPKSINNPPDRLLDQSTSAPWAPRAFFYFQGSRSGLMLPSLCRWPSARASPSLLGFPWLDPRAMEAMWSPIVVQ